MVLVLVLLPALAGAARRHAADGRRGRCAWTGGHHARQGRRVRRADAGRSAARLIPWLLAQVARTGSRELFTLTVLASPSASPIVAPTLFGVSFALGAFFAGMVVSESESATARPTNAAAARRLRGAVLRLGRHAVRPDDPDRAAGRAARGAGGHRRRQVARRAALIVLLLGYPRETALTVAASPRADRRVLVHPGRARQEPRPAVRRGVRADSGRRAPVDRAESAGVPDGRRTAQAVARHRVVSDPMNVTLSQLLERADALLARIERIVPDAVTDVDWSASIAFRWRKRDGRGRLVRSADRADRARRPAERRSPARADRAQHAPVRRGAAPPTTCC